MKQTPVLAPAPCLVLVPATTPDLAPQFAPALAPVPAFVLYLALVPEERRVVPMDLNNYSSPNLSATFSNHITLNAVC